MGVREYRSIHPAVNTSGTPPLPPPPLSQPEKWTVGRWRTSSLNWTFSFQPGVAVVTAARQPLNYITCSFPKQQNSSAKHGFFLLFFFYRTQQLASF